MDLAGTWVPIAGADIRKYRMDLTPKAQAWLEDYRADLDQTNLRCVSPGIVAMIAWAAYPSEWPVDEDRITIIYEVKVRCAVFTWTGESRPSPTSFADGLLERALGRQLARDRGATPVHEREGFSRGAHLGERALHRALHASDDGTTLSAVMTLHDPESYVKPPIRRRMWRRDADAAIFPYECDPDSFFRQLHEEGRMDVYIERADRRG